MPRSLHVTGAQVLDRKLPELQAAAAVLRARPVKGWIHALRTALGMSVTALARRLQVSHSTVLSFEKAEVTGRIQLDTLQRIAQALDAEVVVALVPRRPLREMQLERARAIAREELFATDSSMRLEDQAVDSRTAEMQLEAATAALMEAPKKLWR